MVKSDSTAKLRKMEEEKEICVRMKKIRSREVYLKSIRTAQFRKYIKV